MSKIKDLLGTISTIFRLGIGTSSVILKNLGGSLSFRNSNDSAFVDVACKNVISTGSITIQNAASSNQPVTINTYTVFGSEYGLRVPILQIDNGRMDFNPLYDNAEIRVNGADTTLGFYNITTNKFYLRVNSSGDLSVTRNLSAEGNIIASTGTTNPNNARLYVDGVADINGIVRLRSYTQATLPSASANPGAIAYVTDGSNPLAISNGTSWAFPGSGGGSSGVSSFNGRTGAVVPDAADYSSFYVETSDSRLTDARTPLAHNQSWSTITDTPTTLAGYGITDARSESVTVLEDHFLYASIVTNNPFGQLGLVFTTTGCTVYPISNSGTNHGVIAIDTGTVATNHGLFRTAPFAFRFGETAFSLTQIVQLTPPTAAQAFSVNVGFGDAIAGNGSIIDGARFFCNEANANWQCITTSNSISTGSTTVTSVPVSTNYVILRIDVNKAATQILYFINNVLVATHTTNIPVGSGRETGLNYSIRKTVGTTARSLNIDNVKIVIDPL